MKILTYKELESKNSLLPLLDHAFGWTFNPRTFETLAKLDPRLKDSPMGFFAVERGNVIGSVGVMDMTTRTLDGSIGHVGGVYGVATLPSHVKKGVSTALMNAAHQYFTEKDYRFSFLWTSRTIVAHAMYEKLGYVDWLERPTAHKILMPKKAKQTKKKKNMKLDLDQILKVYNKYVESKAGFVVRDKAYMKTTRRLESLSPKDCIITKDGYVIFKTNVGGTWIRGTWIRELAASDAQAMNRLVECVEEKSKDLIYDRAVFDDTLLEVYKSRGYMIQKKSHSILMVKPLNAKASFKKTYGEKFYLTSLDFF
ncbi:GNAT family N-acetyltransferase [Candidatus Bathyarchaeota archaeon]|nr:GNAT family N-acetyltransferase [Candidatus Bathyarchaeota archaeon]